MKLAPLAGLSLASLALGCARSLATPAEPPPPVAVAVTASPSAVATPPAAPAAQRWPFSTHAQPFEPGIPIVEVADGVITVDGAPAGTTKAIDAAGRMQKLDEEFAALKRAREAWTSEHPGVPLPGRALLRIPLGTSMPVIKSVFQTAAFAAYPTLGFLVRTGTGEREGVLWAAARVPSPYSALGSLGLGRADPIVHTLRLAVGADGLTSTWKEGASVFSEERDPRSLLVAPSPAAPTTSPALVKAIHQAWLLRGIPTPSGATSPPDELILSFEEGETIASLITVLDAIAVVRAGTDGHPVTIDPIFVVR